MIRVVIADDQPLIRSAVAGLIHGEDDLDLVQEASDGAEAIDATRRLRPDVVVMDIRMPDVDGVAATTAICGDPDLAGTRVLVLTTFEEDEVVLAALRAGASGFVGKGADPGELMRAIRMVHRGEAVLSATATRALITRALSTPADRAARSSAADRLAVLTEREVEILALVGSGLSNAEIATRLWISESTAKTHVNRTMTKLYAHDRAQLVIAAYESGLLSPGEG